jgi:ABC-type uncharacterized transport system involved in gliding motility auxiliary subunit
MKITRRYKLGLKAQNIVFVVLILAITGLLMWLTDTRYVWQTDWSANGRNSLSQPSKKLMKTLDGPVKISAFVRDNSKVRKTIREFVGQYRRADPNVSLHFVNPDTHPARVRELGITAAGELYIQYDGRSDKVEKLNESALTNALVRLASTSDSHIVFLTGHGERDPDGHANFDLGRFGKALQKKGFHIAKLNLAEHPRIPGDTSMLVIAGPRTAYLAGETRLIEHYVAHGGNLLWLGDPGAPHGLKPLADRLDIRFLNGTIVDATSKRFGVNDVRWLVLNRYPATAITRNFDLETLFPDATAIQAKSRAGWRAKPFLKSRSLPRSWLETGKLEGKINYDAEAGDKAGPLTIGLTLARPRAGIKTLAAARQPTGPNNHQDRADPPRGDQRVVVTGDGDFLANAYLGNGGNLDLGLNIVNWLAGHDRFIDINVPPAPDQHLALSQTGRILLGAGFLVVLPLLLLIGGALVWFRRRRG